MELHDERRQFLRVQGTLALQIEGRWGRVQDIGRGGLGISLNFSLRGGADNFTIGESHVISIKLPYKSHSPSVKDIQVTGTIRHQHHDEEQQRTFVGMEFDALSEEKRQELGEVAVFLAKNSLPLQKIHALCSDFLEQSS